MNSRQIHSGRAWQVTVQLINLACQLQIARMDLTEPNLLFGNHIMGPIYPQQTYLHLVLWNLLYINHNYPGKIIVVKLSPIDSE